MAEDGPAERAARGRWGGGQAGRCGDGEELASGRRWGGSSVTEGQSGEGDVWHKMNLERLAGPDLQSIVNRVIN